MIHVENLTKYYGDHCAVDQIDFDIQRGEILGLLGPNGAGKTTTLRMLTGFMKPTAGSIRVKDFTVEQQALEIKKIIGYLPESAPLYYDMLVYDYLDYIANIRGLSPDARRSRIRELAQLCGTKEVMHQPIAELSKGYRQRVGLAQAMMNDPEILILDEPTSGLDPNQIVEIRDIIRRIGKEKTVVFSTHILSEAEATCDRIMIIHKGKIVADDHTEALKQTSGGQKRIFVTLKNATLPAARDLLLTLHGLDDVAAIDERDGQLALQLTCNAGDDIRANIYRMIKKTDWELIEFYQEIQTLETIFRELTKEG